MKMFSEFVEAEKERLADYLQQPMAELAQACSGCWGDVVALDGLLSDSLFDGGECSQLPGCELLYVVDCEGTQVSSNVMPEMVNRLVRGQHLSDRPYFSIDQEKRGRVVLSDVYISQATRRSCITAIFEVERLQEIVGFVAIDLRLSALPQEKRESELARHWMQIKGDPSVRQTLFMQERQVSRMDQQLDDVLSTIDELMVERGVFHTEIHFSSSRAMLWLYDEPHQYHIHVLDEILQPSVCLGYAGQGYPQKAMVPKERVGEILKKFKLLRLADEVVYLRDASLNLVNGMVGLHFSCDGQHYMPYEAFLSAEDSFWFGEMAA
ncbi:MAG: hypothetical protein HOG56_02530 [Gammaproteobacteria bacterium]|nr:hypothetical protein [Gammaproteobacteria bacterium]